MPFEVHQDRTVVLPTPEHPVIHADHLWGRCAGQRGVADLAQQCVGTRVQSERAEQTGARLAPERESHRLQPHGQAFGLSGMRGHQLGKALGEDRARAALTCTPKWSPGDIRKSA